MGTLGVPQFNFCNQPRMPSDAWVEIQRTVLDPILAEDKFKAFHDLVLSIPAFVNTSQIRSLRDLEKTFVWLAPVSAILTSQLNWRFGDVAHFLTFFFSLLSFALDFSKLLLPTIRSSSSSNLQFSAFVRLIRV